MKSVRIRESGFALTHPCARGIDHTHTYTLTHTQRNLIRRLARAHVYEDHDGCVNTAVWTPDGHHIITGSDDRRVIVWDARTHTRVIRWDTCHRANVFSAKLIGASGIAANPEHARIVTCAADGQVRLHVIKGSGARVGTRCIGRHAGRAHKLAVREGESEVFMSAGEDGRVMLYDLRCPREEEGRMLMMLRTWRPGAQHRATRMSINICDFSPRNPHHFLLGGADPVVRVFDLRAPGTCIVQYCPLHLRMHHEQQGATAENQPVPQRSAISAHITGAQWNHDGTEIVATYNDEHIYTFRVDDSVADADADCVSPNRWWHCADAAASVPLEVGPDDHPFDVLVGSAGERALAPAGSASMSAPGSGGASHAGDETAGTERSRLPFATYSLPFCPANATQLFDVQQRTAFRLSPIVPSWGVSAGADVMSTTWRGAASLAGAIAAHRASPRLRSGEPNAGTYEKRFAAHRNNDTVKGVAFMGPESEYVVTGCDTGHIFIYDARNGEVLNMLRGDAVGAVNCLSPHPSGAPILLTSGLEHDAKVWAPSADVTASASRIASVSADNERGRNAALSSAGAFGGFDLESLPHRALLRLLFSGAVRLRTMREPGTGEASPEREARVEDTRGMPVPDESGSESEDAGADVMYALLRRVIEGDGSSEDTSEDGDSNTSSEHTESMEAAGNDDNDL